MYSTILVLALIFAILNPINATAGTATQTDWSGGDGIYGPVSDWYSVFYTDTDIECYYNPSDLMLLREISLSPIEYTVDGNYSTESVCSADFDGDNDMDILGVSFSDGDVSWWENNNGSGTSWTEHTIDGDFTGVKSAYSADINGDGDMDVVGASHSDSTIAWWENDNGSGTSWTKYTIDNDVLWANCVYSEDIDGDGDLDVLGTSPGYDEISWWENDNGSGTSWTKHIVSSDVSSGQSVYAMDINGDGDMDILGANYGAGDDIIWWENDNGSGTSWTEHVVDSNFSDAMSVYSADINGDGYMDILGAAKSANDIAWWRNMNGSGTSWTEYTIDGSFDGANCVYASDFDGDGDMDVLGAAKIADKIVCWENIDGSGTAWAEFTLKDNFIEADGVCAADINGDGYMDAVGTAQTDADILWWNLTSFISSGSLESSVLYTIDSPDWQYFDWNCTEPSGTEVAFQVRASISPSNLGPWSDTLRSPCSLEGLLSDSDHFFQYKAILTTTGSLSTPVLHDVTVNWNLLGIQGVSGSEFALYGARPNPTTGNAALFFSMPVESNVELSVYDLTGRIVHSVSHQFESGVHEMVLDNLACGIYMVRMVSEEFTATRQFVVIE